MTPEEAVTKVTGLIYQTAKKYSEFFRNGKIDLEDLVQAGRMGALRAHEKFEPSRNLQFVTYANYWIRAYISRECMEHGRTVRVGVQFQRLEHKAGRLVPISSTNIDDLAPYLRAQEPQANYENNLKDILKPALAALNPRQRKLIQMRYYDEMTLEEIAGKLDICRERVRQLCEKALDRMYTNVPEHAREYLE